MNKKSAMPYFTSSNHLQIIFKMFNFQLTELTELTELTFQGQSPYKPPMCPSAIHLLTGHGTSLRQLHQWRTHGRYGREGFPQWFLDEAKPVRDVSTCRHVRDADSETSSGHEDTKSSKKPGSPCRDNVRSRHSSNAS